LGIGDWAHSPIPNPQSPIPNPHNILIILNSQKKEIEFEYKFIQINFIL